MAPTHYGYDQLKELWIKAGGRKEVAGLAAAIALAESGGDPNAQHRNSDGSIDRGLWQINSVHGAQSTTDVTANVKAAISISNNGKTFRPWTTYQSGAYTKFLSGHLEDVPKIGDVPDSTSISGTVTGGVTDAVDATGDALKSIGSFLAELGKASTWLHVLEVVGGVILVAMGLRVLTGSPVLPKVVPVPI